MKIKSKPGLLAVAALSLPLAAPAHSQSFQPMDPQSISAAVRYGLPVAFDSFRNVCAAELSAEGFVALNAERLYAKFSEGADESWPEAKNLLFQQMTKDRGGDLDEFITELPDEALKPMIDALISTLVTTEIKPKNCADIERGLELLDPLPPENLAQLVGFMVEMDDRDKKGKSLEDQPAVAADD